MARLEVEFPVSYGMGETATELRELLVAQFAGRPDVDVVSLRPQVEPVVGIAVDGDRVWSIRAGERLDPREAVRAVRSRLGA